MLSVWDILPGDPIVAGDGWECGASETLLCPLAILASGHQSLVDKLYTLIHQLWLQFGPGVASVQRACEEVRAVVTDMGVEFGLAGARMCLKEYKNFQTNYLFPDLFVLHYPLRHPWWDREKSPLLVAASSGDLLYIPVHGNVAHI